VLQKKLQRLFEPRHFVMIEAEDEACFDSNAGVLQFLDGPPVAFGSVETLFNLLQAPRRR
jgi:hypothetical protein